jgi:monofunctional biosynthetic peptidoglycan transglycosylase
VANNGLDACVYKGAAAPVNKAPPSVAKAPRPLPGEEYESPKAALPPVENVVNTLPPASAEPSNVAKPQPGPEQNEAAPPPPQPKELGNRV